MPCSQGQGLSDRERELLLALRPRFNRAAAWPAPPKFFAWRPTPAALELTVLSAQEDDWECHGPLGSGAVHLRAALARLIWLALEPTWSVTELPAWWLTSHRHARSAAAAARQHRAD